MPEINRKAGAVQAYAGSARRLMQPIGTIPGVILALDFSDYILGAADRNGPGKGAIRSEGNGKRIAWRAPGSAMFGPPVDVGSDGDYLLEDGEDPGKFVQARVKAAYLSPKPVEKAVYLQGRFNIDFFDVTAGQAAAGNTSTTTWTVKNFSPNTVHNCRVWVDPAVSYLSLSVVGSGGPFFTPTTEAAALLVLTGGGAAQGQLYGSEGNTGQFWVRRTIPAATASNAKVLSLLHFVFDGV